MNKSNEKEQATNVGKPSVSAEPKAGARGKRYAQARSRIDRGKEYSLEEAVKLVKETSKVKFDASVEVHCRLGIDPKKAEQTVRTSVVLPHSTGKKRKIAVFTSPDKEREAKTAGADIVGGEELVKEILKTGKADFDIAIATPDFMKSLAPAARVLGQKGLMPNPKNETVTTNLAKTIKELQGGKLTVRSDESGNVHGLVGKVSLSDQALADNIQAFLAAIKKAKPSDTKGTYLRSMTVTSAMGPGIRMRA
jgi:large subunit ribosomal protein L1